MAQLKRISAEAIPAALDKALRYRLLNEPSLAESICRDVLEVDSGNNSAMITLILALTDQFETDYARAHGQSKEALALLTSDYERAYYEGIIHERWASAQVARGMPEDIASGWIRKAMRCYEQAELLSRPDDADAILRWNTCARVLQRREEATSRVEDMTHDVQAEFGDDIPLR